ncbi:MAG: sulfotransferase family protein [Gammaproteobacteria bacterium]
MGPPRSGTSLISRIVGSHPAIAVPYESHFYNTFAPWIRHYGDLGERRNRERLLRDALQTAMIRDWRPRVDRHAAMARIESNGRFDLHGVFAGIMETWCAAQGKRRWGEKTPAHVFFADRILEGFSHARFICIVRDGRDAALSWMRAQFGPMHVYPAATRWVAFLAAARKLRDRLGATRFLQVRYEDLVDSPEAITRQVCRFVGEDYVGEMLAFHRSEGRYPTDAQNEENLARPVLENNTGKWQRALSSRELRIFEAVAGRELQANGYPRAMPHAAMTRAERLRCAYLEHPPRKLLGMARNFRGQLDGLIRVLLYLRLRAGL